jgi:hypothetical protein
MGSDWKTAIQAAVDSGDLAVSKKPKSKHIKRKGQRSTGELTLRTLRWLVETRLEGIDAGVTWHKPENTETGRELLSEINTRLDDYARGPRGPSSVDNSDR